MVNYKELGLVNTKEMFARAIKVMYKIGAALELKRLGYKFEEVNLPPHLGSMPEC